MAPAILVSLDANLQTNISKSFKGKNQHTQQALDLKVLRPALQLLRHFQKS